MKIGIIVLSRFNSTRLAGKALRLISDETMLGSICNRLKKNLPSYDTIVATSSEYSDQPIVDYCRRSCIRVFRGDLDNVAKRFLNCSEINGFDYSVRINGDNYFTDCNIVENAVSIALSNSLDYVSNVPNRSYPYGMSVEVIKTSFYKEVIKNFDSDYHNEHVTSWIYENVSFGRMSFMKNIHYPKLSGLKLSIDTEDDICNAISIKDRLDRRGLTINLRNLNDVLNEQKVSPWCGKFGPLLIAEIGGNHEGDFEVAKKYCQYAIDTKVDCIKFQIYTGSSLVSQVESPQRYAHFQKFELSNEEHLFLAEMCIDAGMQYNASAWDIESLMLVDKFLSFYKIGSGDLTNYPLINILASRGKPILLSTGLATFDEIQQTIAYIQSVNGIYSSPNMLCIMQCTSMYPIPDCDANLNIISKFRTHSNLSVGYSDHTVGSTALLHAAALGADVLEFHFTDSRQGKVFRDHTVSLIPEEVISLQDDLCQLRTLRGSYNKLPTQSEIETDHITSFRRACYTNKLVRRGQKFKKSDIVTLRPLHGMDARDYGIIIDSIALCDIQPYSQISIAQISKSTD